TAISLRHHFSIAVPRRSPGGAVAPTRRIVPSGSRISTFAGPADPAEPGSVRLPSAPGCPGDDATPRVGSAPTPDLGVVAGASICSPSIRVLRGRTRTPAPRSGALPRGRRRAPPTVRRRGRSDPFPHRRQRRPQGRERDHPPVLELADDDPRVDPDRPR